jgi:hypothetical protein
MPPGPSFSANATYRPLTDNWATGGQKRSSKPEGCGGSSTRVKLACAHSWFQRARLPFGAETPRQLQPAAFQEERGDTRQVVQEEAFAV